MGFPGNVSRTSTQAMSVPITRLISATIRDAPTVSCSAAQASGVRTACQNAPGPSAPERHTTAASGMNTTRLRNSTAVPSPRPVPARPGRTNPSPGLADARLGPGGPVLCDAGSDSWPSNAMVLLDIAYPYLTETPIERSISAMMPDFESKNSLLTLDQPPRSV